MLSSKADAQLTKSIGTLILLFKTLILLIIRVIFLERGE
jgi:uncharacterized membrane protein